MKTKKSKKIKKSSYRSKYISRKSKKYYQGGGMYADNTVASAGQGVPTSTSSIVYKESDPRLQEQRVAKLEEETSRAQQEAAQTAAEAEQTIEQGKIKADTDALRSVEASAKKEAQIKQGLGVAKEAALQAGIGKSQPGALSSAMNAYRLQRAANLAAKATKLGVEGAGAAASTKALALAAKAFLTSGAGIGLIGAGLGYGVKSLWGDKDPTTATTADIAAGALSGAGTGASFGSFLGPVGTAVGGVLGGIYGGAKTFFSARKARKAKEKAEREYKAKVTKAVKKANKATMKGFGSQLSAVRAGETAQKTYSGYDLGRNVVAQMGGIRLGMPRYGAAA